MSLKLLFLISAVLLASTLAFENDGDVLVLGDDDFPKILEDYPYILIEFYAPWCGHCKSLAPVYSKAATALKEAGSEIKLAKYDADTHKKIAGEFGVKGFPTLFFFINGTKIDYKGDRSEEGIISWVNKKILPVTTDLNSESDYSALSKNDGVSVVLFSTDESELAKFQNFAIADDYNRYYVAKGELQDNEASGTVKLFRNFDEVATFSEDFEALGKWVTKHSRPALLPFDQRTIQAIFGEAKKAIVYINTGSDVAVSLRDNVISEAKADNSGLIFTEIDKSSEHFERFADYIKVPVDQPRLVLVDGGNQKKGVQTGEATASSIKQFMKSVVAGEAKLVGLTDAVENLDKTTDEEL